MGESVGYEARLIVRLWENKVENDARLIVRLWENPLCERHPDAQSGALSPVVLVPFLLVSDSFDVFPTPRLLPVYPKHPTFRSANYAVPS